MNYAFLGRDIEIKRTSVNYSFFERFRLHSNSNAKLRIRLVVIFSLTSILSQNIKKMQGGPLGKKIFRKKKSRSAEKNERGESLVSPGMVCYAEKQEKRFWFSSLDQIVHFDAIIFCRTFVELFWSVRVDRKKRVTIIVAFHFMKRRLKRSYTMRTRKLHYILHLLLIGYPKCTVCRYPWFLVGAS